MKFQVGDIIYYNDNVKFTIIDIELPLATPYTISSGRYYYSLNRFDNIKVKYTSDYVHTYFTLGKCILREEKLNELGI
jgi:hypothetical protein